MVKAAVLDRLWTRMSERGDFPMLSQSLRTTMAAMNNDDLDFTGLFHGVDERVPVDALHFGADVLARVLRSA